MNAIAPAFRTCGLWRTEPNARAVAGLLQSWIGFVFIWAWLALWFQAEGLIGPQGILPAGDLLAAVRQAYPGYAHRLALVPSLLWLSSGTAAIHWICGIGLAASVLMMLRLHPRWAVAACLLCFLSFLSTAQVFASYQSDGMLMSAGLIALFLDARHPRWWALFSFRWLWFTIYFGSGIAKIASGDPQWRHFTALDHYFENSPLPTWIGWSIQQHLPHGAGTAAAALVLVLELGVVWLCFGPRRARLACFWITTPFQIAILLTSNYGFLNYLVLGLGFALLDDRHLEWLLGPARRLFQSRDALLPPPDCERARWLTGLGSGALIAYVLITGLNLGHRLWPPFPAPERLTAALAPFRITDPFGLFAVMTTAEYEIEFQGSRDGETWTAYPFRFKPQDPHQAPGLDGPYQPRFDWNLWFAALGSYRTDPWVLATEVRLLQNDPAVLALFAGNPFARRAPLYVRAVLWQYWFSTPAQKRQQGIWWTRQDLGLYAPAVSR